MITNNNENIMIQNTDAFQDMKRALADFHKFPKLGSIKHAVKLARELQETRPIISLTNAPYIGYIVFAPKLNIRLEVYENPSSFFDVLLNNWNHIDWDNSSTFDQLLKYLDCYITRQENNIANG